MTLQLRKPILVGGMALSFGLWLWWNIRDTAMEIGELSLVGTIAIGGSFWWLKYQWGKRSSQFRIPTSPNREEVEAAIAQTRDCLATLQAEDPDGKNSDLEAQLHRLPEQLAREEINIAIAGEKLTGKTCLQKILIPLMWEKVTWQEISTPFPNPTDEEQSRLQAADAVLWLVTGDLTDSQLQVLQGHRSANQRILLLLNKSDRYLPEERETIWQQLHQHILGILPPEDVISILAAPAPLKVRQHQADGTIEEWEEAQKPDIQALRDRLDFILTEEREELVWGTTWREAQTLQQLIQTRLNDIRRDRALPIVERYQWIAAAAAFANPVAALDLLATAAVSGQMLMDLGAIYQQKLSLSLGKNTAGAIGQLMVKLGIVELSTQAIGHFLKSNAITYVAGGVVQGISAAYLTRLAGLSLIEYFQDCAIEPTVEGNLNWERLTQKLTAVFEQNQRTDFLQDFTRQAIARLGTQTGVT
ncbi:MAG: YcjF family protein [Spirulina sp.]